MRQKNGPTSSPQKPGGSYYLPGLVSTLQAAGISVITSIVFGVVFGMARLAQNRVLRWFGTIVVEFFRAVPVLMMTDFLLAVPQPVQLD